MKIRYLLSLALLVNTSAINVALAASGDLYVYPTQNQSEAQQQRDRYECYVWANRETGFNPGDVETVNEARIVRVPVARNPRENALTVGTILGAIVGVAIDDSSRGAAIGAGVGAIAGSAARADGQRQVEQEATAEAERLQAENEELLLQADAYRRAFAACLEGRDYVVR